ncbi:hypothetical protein BJ875DRAFT_387012 [Amylocarpus encephaloides]|uniref:HIT-type domain-containing protein n=1 Tax=Amylocarpus encephaloides TaxID=45428 RepID=A0A9P8C0P1_9HELO|nr:hypothetical protein BJ875DRAFT_387012 [Amylocarpus encephaloides]
MESQEGASPDPDLPSTNEVHEEAEQQGEGPDSSVTNASEAVEATIPPSLETTLEQPKMCGVCEAEESKYKCSACYLPYCSIPCVKIHKVNHPISETPPSPPVDKDEAPVSNPIPPRPGTVSATGYKGPFAALDDSQELKLLFEKYPSLSAQLNTINTATLPPVAGDTEFPQRDPRKNGKSEPWTTDRGLQKGIEAMNRARADGSKDGQAVREYYRLVLRILSGEGTVGAAEVIQQEIEDENLRIISGLLERENG